MGTGVTQPVTEEVEEVQRVMKSLYLLSFMLKPPSLIAQGFNKNKNIVPGARWNLLPPVTLTRRAYTAT